MLKQISTKNAPKAVGPYSQAIIDTETNIIYISGQIAINPETNIFDNTQTIEKQTETIMNNIESILEGAGSCMDNAIKITLYLTDISEYKKINDVYGKYFTSHKPVRVAVGVASLPLGANIEIQCDAKVF